MEIKRKLYEALKTHLEAKEITLLVGARQVGKTTMLKKLLQELESAGNECIFLNLDIDTDKRYFKDQSTFIQKLQLEFGDQPAYVFIDEIQRKTNAGLFLKGLYDRDLPYKFVVSGSGSLELKEKIQESLAGRKRMFELGPVSFVEFVNYRTGYKYEAKLAQFFALEQEKLDAMLFEYINYGGYPRIITENKAKEKRALIEEIFKSYIEKDVTSLLNISRPEAFVLLIRLLADRAGKLINYAQLSSEAALSTPTLKKYLWYAEKTFIVKQISPFFNNMNKELTKSPQIYFKDLGLRNHSLNLEGRIGEAHNTGFVFQNFIFQLLEQHASPYGWQTKFWRSKDKAEVDFVLDNGRIPIPIEVKYQKLKKPKISRSFRSFIEKYKPEKAFLINLEMDEVAMLDTTEIHIIPYHKLITENYFVVG